jgi:hypothetical protein
VRDYRGLHIVVQEPNFAIEDLRSFWADLPDFGEVWVERLDGSRVCALISSRLALLMYLRHEGDAGFSTRNSKYSGPSDATLEFVLGNDQVDQYPAAWTYSAGETLLALERFAIDGVFPREIEWHNDSADGASAPTAL